MHLLNRFQIVPTAVFVVNNRIVRASVDVLVIFSTKTLSGTIVLIFRGTLRMETSKFYIGIKSEYFTEQLFKL